MDIDDFIKGRGAQNSPHNKFLSQEFSLEEEAAIDEYTHLKRPTTQIFYEAPKKIINKVLSPDVGMEYSLNPYQGCEHGCVYCYARTTHEYWGYNSGLDFESKIIVKKNAAALLEKELLKPGWQAKPIVLSGNTDCYQPLEQKLRITRSLLEVFSKYRHPVGIITKNTCFLNDLDVLKELASDNLVRVILSITSLDETLRSKLEPRTASAKKKLEAIEILSKNNIPVSVMTAPIIPGLNHHEIPAIIKSAAERGAVSAGYTVVRLNGSIKDVFSKWLQTHFPDRYDKVWNQIAALHGGNVSDSQWNSRMRGEGAESDMIKQLFEAAKRKYMAHNQKVELNTSLFRKGGNYKLF